MKLKFSLLWILISLINTRGLILGYRFGDGNIMWLNCVIALWCATIILVLESYVFDFKLKVN